jgi:hypothetical protein
MRMISLPRGVLANASGVMRFVHPAPAGHPRERLKFKMYRHTLGLVFGVDSYSGR